MTETTNLIEGLDACGSWCLALTTICANCRDWCEKFLRNYRHLDGRSSPRYQFLRRSPMNLQWLDCCLNLWWVTEVLDDQVVSERSFINGCSELSFYLPGDDCIARPSNASCIRCGFRSNFRDGNIKPSFTVILHSLLYIEYCVSRLNAAMKCRNYCIRLVLPLGTTFCL